jgi:hypothetical protein
LGSFTGGLIVSISFFVGPFGFQDSDTSLIISILPVTGGLGIYVAQKILKKTRAYKKFIMASIFVVPFNLFLILFFMESGNVWIAMIGFGLLGYVALRNLYKIKKNLAVIPAYYELSSELAFPVGEGSSLGYLIGICSLNAFITGVLFSSFIIGDKKEESYLAAFVISLIFFTSFLFMIATKQDLRRTKAELNK